MNGGPKHLSNSCNNSRNDLGKSIYTNNPEAKFSKFSKSIYTNNPELVSYNLIEILYLWFIKLHWGAAGAPENFYNSLRTSKIDLALFLNDL